MELILSNFLQQNSQLSTSGVYKLLLPWAQIFYVPLVLGRGSLCPWQFFPSVVVVYKIMSPKNPTSRRLIPSDSLTRSCFPKHTNFPMNWALPIVYVHTTSLVVNSAHLTCSSVQLPCHGKDHNCCNSNNRSKKEIQRDI